MKRTILITGLVAALTGMFLMTSESAARNGNGGGRRPAGGYKPAGSYRPAGGGYKPARSAYKPAGGGYRPVAYKPASNRYKPVDYKPAGNGYKPVGYKPVAYRPVAYRPVAYKPVAYKPGGGYRPNRIVAPKPSVRPNYARMYGKRFSFGVRYSGRNHRHWTHRCWSNSHRCWVYWDPCCHCYYYWCVPGNCFYPVSHCPYDTYCWNDDNFCVDSVPAIDSNADDPTTVPVEEDADTSEED